MALRKGFNELKLATERDVSTARAELGRLLRNLHASALNCASNLRAQDTASQVCLDVTT